ncbi:MAG: CPBP family intramembrane metalloprotease [Deltaproteobacteria bacterium]|nr:CPBP family intramembrane metalloprotease [Deltaproteobacteria bacterium]
MRLAVSLVAMTLMVGSIVWRHPEYTLPRLLKRKIGGAGGPRELAKGILLGLAGTPVLFFLCSISATLAVSVTGVPIAEAENAITAIWRISPLLLLAVGIAAAIVEELIFRGILLDFARDRWGFPAALLVSSAVFALFHLSNAGFNATAAVHPFVAGLLLGLLCRSGGLRASITAHAEVRFSSRMS